MIVTTSPGAALVGVKLVIVGGVTMVKIEALVPVPPGVVTEIWPVVAPFGTVALIEASETTENVADVPLNVTDVAPVNPDPEMTTVPPTGPLTGLNEEMVGNV